MPAKIARQVQIFTGAKGENRAVRVTHSGKLSPAEVTKVNTVLVNDVIKRLTGCPCMSGIIDVVWEKQYSTMIEVDLAQ